MSNERKASAPKPHTALDINSAANLTNKRACLVKQELLRNCDKWGQQLPVRLLAEILCFAGAAGLGRSQEVCSGWRFLQNTSLLNRCWRTAYEGSWESGSGALPEIASEGADTAWSVRYRRRLETED